MLIASRLVPRGGAAPASRSRQRRRGTLRKQVFGSENSAIHQGAETVCGRITQDLNLATLFAMYGLSPAAPALNLAPRYNGCPTQDFVAFRAGREGPALAKLRWGLVPMWAKDLKVGARMINARSETVHEKPAFRSAFRRRRCVIPVNGSSGSARAGRRSRTGSGPRAPKPSRSPACGNAGRRPRSRSRLSRFSPPRCLRPSPISITGSP